MILSDVMDFLDVNEAEKCSLVCLHWLQIWQVFQQTSKTRRRVFKELFIEDREIKETEKTYRIVVKNIFKKIFGWVFPTKIVPKKDCLHFFGIEKIHCSFFTNGKILCVFY